MRISNSLIVSLVFSIWLGWTGQIRAANPPSIATKQVRLGIIGQATEIDAAADWLTTLLSQNPSVVMLERAEMDKVLHEQTLAVVNGDNLFKLGEILGADGLVILEKVEREGQIELITRLVAVKPGVVLGAVETQFPPVDAGIWSKLAVEKFLPLLPKLEVLTKDAIPISPLNLRAAVKSKANENLETELNSLLVSRLMNEKRVFVLERRNLKNLAEEKGFKVNTNSTFWNGSYLLEGTIDQNGTERGMVSVNARMAAPGKEPINIEVTGKRGELSSVINDLVNQIMTALKAKPEDAAWNPLAESRQYYEEGKWALKWGVMREGKAASDSAWVLGKKDEECATLRISLRLAEARNFIGKYKGTYFQYHTPQYHGDFEDLTRRDDWGELPIYGFTVEPLFPDLWRHTAYTESFPTVAELKDAQEMLEIYDNFLKTIPPADTASLSNWNNFGLQTLEGASQVLEHFQFVPESQKNLEAELATVRSLAREVSGEIENWPGFKSFYWLGDRTATLGELERYYLGKTNIFVLTALYGCVWQDTPQQGVAVYQRLMQSPVCAYIDKYIWSRPVYLPKLAAWNERDAMERNEEWKRFESDLGRSTNFWARIEQKIFEFSEATSESQLHERGEALFNLIFENQENIEQCNVQLSYWRYLAELIEHYPNDESENEKNKILKRYYAEYQPRILAMDKEFATHRDFENRKRYLLEPKGFNLAEFAGLFATADITKDQGRVLLPLMETFRSNLLANSHAASAREGQLINAGLMIEAATESRWRAKLNAVETSKPNPTALTIVATSAPKGERRVESVKKPGVTNLMVVEKYLPVPSNELPLESPLSGDETVVTEIVSHRFSGGKLLCEIRYRVTSKALNYSSPVNAAIGVLDLEKSHWMIIGMPSLPGDSHFGTGNTLPASYDWCGEHMFLVQDAEPDRQGDVAERKSIFSVYDFGTHRWTKGENPIETCWNLKTVNGRIYGSDSSTVVEILHAGTASRLLVSTRRRPVRSVVDELDSLGQAVLQTGMGGRLRLFTMSAVYEWDERDWKSVSSILSSRGPEAIGSGVLFAQMASSDDVGLWALENNETNSQYLWHDIPSAQTAYGVTSLRAKPLWKNKGGLRLGTAHAVSDGNNYFFLVDHVRPGNEAFEYSVHHAVAAPQNDGRDASLVELRAEWLQPLVIGLKFKNGEETLTNLQARFASAGREKGFWIESSSNQIVMGYCGVPGIWLLAKAAAAEVFDREVALARAGEKLEQLSLLAAEEKVRLAAKKFDLNGDGIIDDAEKNSAIANLTFLESQLEVIDANHDGVVDAEELGYFDLDRNRKLRPELETSISAVEHLLAKKMIASYDEDGDGLLSDQELSKAKNGFKHPEWFGLQMFGMQSPPHDVNYITGLLEEYTVNSLKFSLPFFPKLRPTWADIKPLVEAYWQKHPPK